MEYIPSIFGLKIITSKYLTYRARRIFKRSWRERLFSLSPHIKRKIVVVDVPSRMYYIMKKENTLIVHPLHYDKMILTVLKGGL